MNRLVNPAKVLRTLRKTPILLEALLEGVTQEQAETLYDGDWNVVFVVSHLRDFEAIAAQRVRDLLAGPNPTFAAVSNDELIRDNNYAAADLHQVMGEIARLRRELITLLESLRVR